MLKKTTTNQNWSEQIQSSFSLLPTIQLSLKTWQNKIRLSWYQVPEVVPGLIN
jgi:hypothetical protein